MTKEKSPNLSASVRKGGLERNVPEFSEVLARLRAFLLLPLNAASGLAPLPGHWLPGGPWKR